MSDKTPQPPPIGPSVTHEFYLFPIPNCLQCDKLITGKVIYRKVQAVEPSPFCSKTCANKYYEGYQEYLSGYDA